MAGKKKFGAFAGVFTPSILTILGVIMYMRMGWVVGNAGLVGTIIIVLIAHVIAISTGLSVSSVATDKKIGAGGIYYVLSRSMGIPIGGSIGIALYVGTAFSIALYLIGFAESFNGYVGWGTTVNDLRITGTAALVLLTALALISTSVALKAQFFILAAIIISLVSIFFGTQDYAPETVAMFATKGSVPMEMVFAIFFPAVTGFTAGIAMSGDLKDPKKSIPVGTLMAIGVGLIVYLGLAFFISFTINSEELRTDYNILMKMALFAPAVVAGIWGATLSSALGGILGGPRILQAMSLDQVTPKVFGRGKGKNNEPVNALILVFIIAEAGILIGELDVIARVVSMFYLTAYGFINISYFLESWANPDFQPTFKIKRWIGLVGFIACFAVMFKLDMIAMFGSFAVVGGLYFWLQRKQIQLQSSDVWQSVWSNVVNKGLKKLEVKEGQNSNWNPNIILFSGETQHRDKLLEFSKTISGRTGIVTDFKLVNNAGIQPISRNEQAFKDEILENLGIYGRRIEVEDPYLGVENIASTYGFAGVEPNTVMMNWSRTTQDPTKYAKMTQKLIHLDYNLLYLDYDERTHFGNYQTIDLWWRETDSNNAELMLNISRYISQSAAWAKAKIRILFVNHNNADNAIINSKIANLIGRLRIDAEIKIINNGVEQKSFYKIIELQSAETDLILLGIPNVQPEKQANYILNTDQLFDVVGTTLLVKASHNFNVLDLDFVQKESFHLKKLAKLNVLPGIANAEVNTAVAELDRHLSETTQHLAEPSFSALASSYCQLVDNFKEQFEKMVASIDRNHSVNKVTREIQVYINQLVVASDSFREEKLPEIEALFQSGIAAFLKERSEFLQNAPKRINSEQKIYWNYTLNYFHKSKIVTNTEAALYDFGVQNWMLLSQLTEGVKDAALLFLERISKNKAVQEDALQEFAGNIRQLFVGLQGKCAGLETLAVGRIQAYERDLCIELMESIENPSFYSQIKAEEKNLKKKESRQAESRISEYAGNWRKNQVLAHNQLASDFKLYNAGLSVLMVNELIKARVNRLTITPQLQEMKLFSEVISYVGEHLGTEKLDNYANKTLNDLAEGIVQIDFEEILKNEEAKVLSISGKGPQNVRLMSSEAFNNFQECQNEDVEEIDINLSNIQGYIIRSSYLAPLQESLAGLEKVFKENAEELYNASNLVKHILSESLTAESRAAYRNSLSQAQKRVADRYAELQKVEKSFNYDLSVHVQNTLAGLNIRTIIESIDSYANVSVKPTLIAKFQRWYKKRKASIARKYDAIYYFIVQRKRDVDSIKFLEKHNQFLNSIEQVNRFVNALEMQPGIENELSFYYKKLFTGSHLGNVNPIYRKHELNAAQRVIQRIDSGTSGAMMILGAAQSGKTYFIETVSSTFMKGERIYLSPPAKQNYDVNDLHIAFQNTFNKSGTAEAILNQMDEKTILIFDDLEKWWLKATNGYAAIHYLAKLIEKFGHKHYFVLSCNIYSFEVIRQGSTIDKQLLATIIVPPASKTELREILMNRHRTAGAELWYNSHQVGEAKRIDSFFSEVHQKSAGNIGVALGIWINSIHKDQAGHLVIRNPAQVHFPTIKEASWKILLYHLALHGGIKEKHIKRTFLDTNWVQNTLKELEKTGLVYKKSNSVYALSNSAQHYIEEWLKELKVLN